jgi:hypothetical protein
MYEFKAAERMFFKTDFDFHAHLAAVLRQLRDAHTRYLMPGYGAIFAFWQALEMISHVSPETGAQVITVHPSVSTDGRLAYIEKHSGVDLTVFAGAEVVSINGVPAIEAMTKFAKEDVCFCKDLGTRFNIALHQTLPDGKPDSIGGLFANRNGDFTPFPDPLKGDSVEYELVTSAGKTHVIKLPWFATVQANVTGVADFNQRFWQAPQAQKDSLSQAASAKASASKTKAKAKAKALSVNAVAELHDAMRMRMRPRAPMPRAMASSGSGDDECTGTDCIKLLFEGPHVHFYFLANHPRVAVMFVDSFEPEELAAFETTVSDGLAAMAALGRDRLIVDLTGNGGGDICLGRRMMRAIAGPVSNDHHFFNPSDMPVSALAAQMAKDSADTFTKYGRCNATFKMLT